MNIQSWLSIIILLLVGLLIKYYLPRYIGEKAKNLATKEDIAEITRKSEEVQNEFRRDYERFSSDIKFKYEFYYKQYVELYTMLYSIICQSEYLRRFSHLVNGANYRFDDIPFIEIYKTKTSSKINLAETGTSIEHHEDKKPDDITNFCKKELCDLIIIKGEFSTQKLLKLAVAYRFVYDNYSSNEEVKNSEVSNIADDEEFLLIAEIVKCIIREYNMLRKELKMDFVKSELEQGVFENVFIDLPNKTGE